MEFPGPDVNARVSVVAEHARVEGGGEADGYSSFCLLVHPGQVSQERLVVHTTSQELPFQDTEEGVQ
jgi:hypothetical protein